MSKANEKPAHPARIVGGHLFSIRLKDLMLWCGNNNVQGTITVRVRARFPHCRFFRVKHGIVWGVTMDVGEVCKVPPKRK